MLLYLHGFASCGDSNKTRLLKRYFGDENVLSPDLPVEPDAAAAFIASLLEREPITALAGSSLGGFYATWACEHRSLPAVLLNPSVRPWKTLAAYVGTNRFWCSGEPFEWKQAYLAQLERYRVDRPAHHRKLVLLQTGDELLDYRIAADYYRACSVVTQEGGNHRFENLEEYLERIAAFIR